LVVKEAAHLDHVEGSMAAMTTKQDRVSKILRRTFKAVEKRLTPEAAEAFLRMKFDKEDVQRMHELAKKS